MRIYFGTAREIEMGRRRPAAPLKQITDKGIDEVQRVADRLLERLPLLLECCASLPAPAAPLPVTMTTQEAA